MRFALTPDQAEMRAAVRQVLSREASPAVVRGAWGDPSGAIARGVWSTLGVMGIAGAAVPETRGGLGLDARSLVPLLEETGRAALPLPVVETAFVAGPLAAAAGERALLEGIVAGDTLVACRLAPVAGPEPSGQSGELLVPYATLSDVVLLGDGRAIWSVPSASAVPVPGLDGARHLAAVSAHPAGGVTLATSPELLGEAWDRGALGTAAQLIGLGRRLLELTVDYVAQRRQFGVAVGSFQAIKHRLADVHLALEFAAPAVARAAWSLDVADAARERHVSMAKALASDAAHDAAAAALQCHGAMGYTTEYDLHLFAKRAWALAPSWGTAAWHRARIARSLGLTT